VPNLAITDNSQNAANTKYVHDTINNGAANFVVATGVPTFQAGEEYIIAVGLLDGEVMINLSLLAGWQSGSTGYNQYDVVSVLGFESSVAFPQASVQIVSNSLPVEYFSIMLYALDYPVTVNNITLPAGSSVFTVKLLQSIPATGTINSSKGSYLSASKDFINQVSSNNYPVLFEPVAPGVLSAASNWFRSVTYQTKANLESPIFVGAPTAPTQPKGSNNATLATMAAITQALGDYTSTVNLQNGSFSPTLNNCSAKSLTVNSSSNTALLSLTQSSANVVSVIPQGLTSALDIDITTKGISIPFQITVPNLATSDNSQKAANTKFVVDYVAATPSGGGIVASGGSGKNRWVKFAPDGNGNQLIMQFGSYSVAANTVVTFPTSFATTNYSVAISTASGTGNGARLSSWNYTNSSSMTCTGVMYIQTTGNTTPASDDGTYIAIGY
jgi:hypothetical protein